MILLETIFIAISISLFFLLKKQDMAKRITISASVFLLLSITLIALLIISGDKPLPGAITVDPKSW
jgi:hypothetical protein